MTRPNSTPALLLDMDGTLIDSEPIWQRHMVALASRFGATWTEEDSVSSVGTPMTTTAAKLRANGVALTDEELLDELINGVRAEVAAEMPWLPGAYELLVQIADRGLPAALVTNSGRANANELLAAAPARSLQFAVTADDVQQGKPDPEPYRVALERLGAARGIAFEDSMPGATSARDAGAEVWFVRTHSDAPAFAAGSVDSLADVDLDALLGLSDRP